MKHSVIFTTIIAVALTGQLVSAGEITDTYATGDTLTTTTLDNIKTAVNDNNTKINAAGGDITAVNTGSGLTGGGISGNVTLSVGTGAITGSHIASGTVRDIDIGDEPGIEYNQNTTTGLVDDIPSSWTSVQQLSVSAPTSGFITCIATGSVYKSDSLTTDWAYVGWDMNNSTTGVIPDSYIITRPQSPEVTFIPYSTMHTYSVAAGLHTFDLKTQTTSSDITDFDLYQQGQVCMFFPTKY